METYPADSTYYEMERILGESYFRKGDYQQAIKYLSGYTTYCTHPQRDSYYALGMAYYKTGNYTEAVQQLGHVTNEKMYWPKAPTSLSGRVTSASTTRPTHASPSKWPLQYDFDREVQEVALYNYALSLHAQRSLPLPNRLPYSNSFSTFFRNPVTPIPSTIISSMCI